MTMQETIATQRKPAIYSIIVYFLPAFKNANMITAFFHNHQIYSLSSDATILKALLLHNRTINGVQLKIKLIHVRKCGNTLER